ncbi:Uma2 family endonuclease [Saccharothrix carnea]|uniref:Uma2 family endonuclease n=1 Tax=Saccharothrix carnea TaxID=1280637 RepID=A0A2P8I784_SACCR|nr:Uma2 family endonuclease [Saccharothrix carnea]PSL54307.1 Uma2 family endonuclease [Saccharothrix carnea]
MDGLPDWMCPPREEGWFAEDLDQLIDAPRHTELIDGALVFRMFPQRLWHNRVRTDLARAVDDQAPDGVDVVQGMTIRLDARNRPEADIIVTSAPFDPDQTWFEPGDVPLVAEVVSRESAFRDRTVKLRKYAAARIQHYWLVDDGAVGPVVHVYELDEPSKAYVATGIFRDSLNVTVPFEIDIDLAELIPRQ